MSTFTTRLLQSREINARYVLHRRLLGAQSSLNVSFLGIEPRFLGCLALSVVTLQTTLSISCSEPWYLSRYSDSLWAGRSGERIPVGARYSAPVQNGSGAYPASYTMGTGSFPGMKRPGCGVDHLPSSSAEVKERVEFYLYSTSGSSWPVIRWILPLPLLSIPSGSSLNSIYAIQLFENQVISARFWMRDTIFLCLPWSAGFKICWKWLHIYSWLQETVTRQQSCSLGRYIKVDNKLHLLKQRSIMK